ncbi:MAG TPA: Mpo1-like protein, partial [Aquabacterium sp.]|nr:Mpo1-like protein [Aquabacterium sp.]
MQRYQSFQEFYPFYLSQHENRVCRRLHVVGSLLVLALLASVITTGQWLALWLLPLLGYGFAWVGHFAFERNKPATFQYPLYSFMGDWVML